MLLIEERGRIIATAILFHSDRRYRLRYPIRSPTLTVLLSSKQKSMNHVRRTRSFMFPGNESIGAGVPAPPNRGEKTDNWEAGGDIYVYRRPETTETALTTGEERERGVDRRDKWENEEEPATRTWENACTAVTKGWVGRERRKEDESIGEIWRIREGIRWKRGERNEPRAGWFSCCEDNLGQARLKIFIKLHARSTYDRFDSH